MSDPFFLCESCKLDFKPSDGKQLHTIHLPAIPFNSKCFMCDKEERKELSLVFTAKIDDSFAITGAL